MGLQADVKPPLTKTNVECHYYVLPYQLIHTVQSTGYYHMRDTLLTSENYGLMHLNTGNDWPVT
jgi:hypothetical protein